MAQAIGIKQMMTTVFDENGTAIPVTVIDFSETVVVSKEEGKSMLGVGKRKKSTRALEGMYKELGYVPKYVKEVKITEGEELPGVGEVFPVDVFQDGDIVAVQGTSKGKGFAGVVKRWGFAGGRASHGQSDRLRAPGSIGAGTTPGRVFKGKKMAGRKGGETCTVKNLRVVGVGDDYILVSGSVPGSSGSYVVVTKQ